LGTPYAQYRPSAGTAALAAGNQIATIPAWLTVDDKLMGMSAPKDGNPVWYGGFDPNLTQPGDYLVGNFGTFFIATQTLPMPISLRYCNVVVTHLRFGEDAPGPMARGGSTVPSVVMAQSFPGFLKVSERRSVAEAKIAGEVPIPSATIFLPPSMPAEILRGDDLALGDAAGTRWSVVGADFAASGWTCVCIKEGA
jgi:hypothetical protein